MKVIFKFIKKQIPIYLVAAIAMFIAIGLDALTPIITKHIVDDVIVGKNFEIFPKLILALLGIGLGKFIFPYIKEFGYDYSGTKVACDLRKHIFNHIQGLSASFFEKNNSGELMARVKDDVDKIWEGVTYVSFLVIEVIFHVIVIIYCMLRLDPILTIFPVIGMIVCGTLAIVMEQKLGKIYGEISEENAALNQIAGENLSGVRTVKAFAREKHEIEKFLSHNQKYYDLNIANSNVFVKYYPFFQLISKLLPITVVLVGGAMVIEGRITLGTLSAFVAYSMNIIWPMEMLGWLSDSVSTAFASAKKLNKIYAEKPDITSPENPVILETVSGTIAFDHVSFKKEDGKEILSDINFEVDAGKSIGIMGSTGSGKSSLVLLLQRFFDPSEGSITLDGVDISELELCQLRKSIATVTQDVFLFSDTIEENVRMGNQKGLNIQSIQKATDNAMAHEFIEKLDDKYETVIGERGVGLSGGQKQRLSIARALSKEAPILILDDSTSALDMETEHIIWQKIHALDNITKFIITHRISTVSKADEIIILDEGKIVERGTHASLLAKKGYYYQTYIAQYGTDIPEIKGA